MDNTHQKYNTDELRERIIAVRPIYKQKTGSFEAAILLSQISFWSGIKKDDGWFYKTRNDWNDETSLTRRELETARAKLLKLKLIEYETRGEKNRGYYRLNREVFDLVFGSDKKEKAPQKRKPVTAESPMSSQEADLIKEFEIAKINPNVKKLYFQSGQREAAREMIKHFGFENAKKFIYEAVIPVNKDRYSGLKITSPKDAWDNLEKINVAIQKLQSEYHRHKKGGLRM